MKAIVFDCDGVLVDSEPAAEAAWTAVMALHGHTVTPLDLAPIRGTTTVDSYALLAAMFSLAPYEDVVADLDEALGREFETRMAAFPDAVDTVQRLAMRGIPLAVASSSRRSQLDAKLARFDLARYFDVTVAGDEVAAGKPAPDLYLAAAAGLRIDPAACLAVEDAAAGARAAASAGMRVVTVIRDAAIVEGFPAIDRLDAALLLTWMGLE
jgi:HAD superfamily hydrolase (TIGR01509 family)